MSTNEGNGGSFINSITGTSLNRIGRAKYIARSMIFSFIISVCSSLLTRLEAILEGYGLGRLGYILLFVLLVVSVYGAVYLNNKRFHDRGASGWWQLLLLIPFVNLIVTLYLWFAPGNEGANEYGEPSETKSREKVLAWILPILIIFLVVGILLGSLLPRMQAAQDRARDVARKTDLSQLQTAIITSQTDTGMWPGMDAAKNGISISDIERDLIKAGVSIVPKDPLASNKFTGIGSIEIKGDYGYLVATRNGVKNGGFILMAKTESEAGSNWVVCENKSGLENGYITSDIDLKNVKPCSVLSKGSSCSNSNGYCTYASTDELRYILMY